MFNKGKVPSRMLFRANTVRIYGFRHHESNARKAQIKRVKEPRECNNYW